MTMRPFFLLASLSALLSACESTATGPECQTTALSQSSTAGDTVTLNTGLRYLTLAQGTGAGVEYCDLVQVSYSGTLTTGAEFDPGGVLRPFYLGYGEVIPGFEQGIVGMRVGETRRLIVPPTLGYGAQEVRHPTTNALLIPANSTLIFDVELLAYVDQ